jgi:hypothetical protein
MEGGWQLSLADLEGAWTMRRRITHGNGTVAALNGACAFRPGKDGLRQSERGLLDLDGQSFEARQDYLWRPGPEIRFADGRPFHAIGAGRRPEAEHRCGEDHYRVSYDFDALGSGTWATYWRVRGPRKTYTMRTTYTRVDPRAGACGGSRRRASKGIG